MQQGKCVVADVGPHETNIIYRSKCNNNNNNNNIIIRRIFIHTRSTQILITTVYT